MATRTKKEFTSGVGRRRSSIARARLYKGRGKSIVNDKPVGKYFPGIVQEKAWNKPFEVTKTEGKYWVSIKVTGGGKEGQLDAAVLGISRALSASDESFRQTLRKHDLLTRDSRIRERRKVGTGGKARRKKQSPKR
ncbi:30S ribosomal protein S9 [Candidatus Woesebacteria bacterium]|nr:30S ribosomal protein S9 [Candidatus Woesebacteria bacterium]|tara:strand:+ start:618 stop:1025 length:408 start_codon:yes stop_codon:yes gene_type:complete